MVVLGGLFVLAMMTKYKLWGPFWRDWVTSIDHKKIGIMYIVLGLVMLLRGFADALMMRKCPTGYRVVREGEARGYSSVSGIREGTEDEGIGRKWGVQFECKASQGQEGQPIGGRGGR